MDLPNEAFGVSSPKVKPIVVCILCMNRVSLSMKWIPEHDK